MGTREGQTWRGFDGCLGWQAEGFGGLRKGSGKVRWSEREAGNGDLGNWGGQGCDGDSG